MEDCPGNRSSYKFELVREVFLEESQVLLPPQFTTFVKIIAFIICGIGIIGNGLVCFLVIKSPTMRTPRNVFITNLALADLAASLTVVPFVFWPQLHNNHWIYGEVACKFYNTFSGMYVFCNSLTIIAIAADRYFAVRISRPNQYSKNMPMVIVSGLIWVISLICCIPVAKFYVLFVHEIPVAKIERDICINIITSNNETVMPHLPICQYRPPNESWKLFVTIGHLLFLLPIPLAFVTIFNWRLHTLLQQQSQRHRRLTCPDITAPPQASHATNRQRKVTFLLIAMVISHGLFWLPFTIFTWANDFHRDIFRHHPILFRGIDISAQLLAYFSICVNPFLYAYFNTNFSREFRHMYKVAQSVICCPAGRATATRKETSGVFGTLVTRGLHAQRKGPIQNGFMNNSTHLSLPTKFRNSYSHEPAGAYHNVVLSPDA